MGSVWLLSTDDLFYLATYHCTEVHLESCFLMHNSRDFYEHVSSFKPFHDHFLYHKCINANLWSGDLKTPSHCIFVMGINRLNVCPITYAWFNYHYVPPLLPVTIALDNPRDKSNPSDSKLGNYLKRSCSPGVGGGASRK